MKTKYAMDNEELQDAIVHTNAMIKSCVPKAARMHNLNKHLTALLKHQETRASLVSLPENNQ